MIKKLLWSKQNFIQLSMAMIGTIIGLFLLLMAVQTYFDIGELLKSDEDNYVIVNKKVGLLNMIGGTSVFNENDLQEIKDLPFVHKSAPFSSSQFQVMAVVPQIGFRSEFFFESVPNDFLDFKNRNFRWKKGQRRIPIVLSRDYLSLYNFGFAPTRGMPPMTESTIQRVVFQIKITSKNGYTDNYSGKVVGFSDRVNSILVPQSFLNWANTTYSSGNRPPAKVMLEVENPYSTEFKSFIDEKNYELSSGKLIGDKVGNALDIMTGVIAVIGVLIVFLALLVFLLNFKLLIAKASDDIRLLLQLGYKYQTIASLLIRRFVILLTVTAFIAFGGMYLIRHIGLKWLFEQGFEMTIHFHQMTIIIGLTVFLLLLLVNVGAIRRNVIQLGKN